MDLPVSEFSNLRISTPQPQIQLNLPLQVQLMQPGYVDRGMPDVEELHYFKKGCVYDEAATAIQTLHPQNYSIEFGNTLAVIFWYNNMPAIYPRLSPEELLEWGRQRLAHLNLKLPDLQSLTSAINDYVLLDDIDYADAIDLLHVYLLQFNWLRLKKDAKSGRYVVSNPDRIR